VALAQVAAVEQKLALFAAVPEGQVGGVAAQVADGGFEIQL
jgi:hypothetical protein